MVATALTGSRPIAVSAESITADEPSKIALATSDTSARVGEGDVIIDSSICVAVITGRPSAMQSRMIRFWRCGSSSMPSSMPRSPRATMIAPDASMIPSRFSTAARVSILATISGPRGCGSVPTRRMSCAERTKRQRHHVDALLDERVEHVEVFGRGGRHAKAVGRHVQAGTALHRAAVGDLGLRDVAVDRDDAAGGRRRRRGPGCRPRGGR